MYHKYKSLLQNMPTRHLLTKTLREPSKLYEQIEKLVHVDIVNFFVAGTSKQVTEVLKQATNPNAKGGPYFSDEFAWYSMSLVRHTYLDGNCLDFMIWLRKQAFILVKIPGDPELPSCTQCDTDVTLVHLIPQPIPDSNRRKQFLATKIGATHVSLTEMFYFDLAVDAILAVG